MYFILPLIGGIILYFIISVAVRSGGAMLNKKFVDLGVLKGKSYVEIEKAVGKPNSVSSAKGGKTIKQWIRTGYHIALIFDEKDICEGVSHQSHA